MAAFTSIYKDILPADRSFVSQESTLGLFSGDTGSMAAGALGAVSATGFNISETQIDTKTTAKYFVDVYDKNPDSDTAAEVQFSIGYGNSEGLGSPTLTQDNTSTTATKAVYLGLKNLLLEPDQTLFTFDSTGTTTTTSTSIYAIIFKRTRYKGYVDPGNWQITLSGSNGAFHFIDDSSQTLGAKAEGRKSGVSFNVSSGSLSAGGATLATNGTYTSHEHNDGAASANSGFGKFYPQKGIIILNADAIDTHIGMVKRTGAANSKVWDSTMSSDVMAANLGENHNTAAAFFDAVEGTDASSRKAMPAAPFTGSLTANGSVYYDQYNWHGLYRAMVLGADISTAGAASNVISGHDGHRTGGRAFQARSGELISSNHYFLRLNNQEFNYSNNPTFATGNSGQLVNQDFESDPKVYVTTVGLYSDANELLAVAKLSRPLEKSFSKEALLRVRLDY